MLIEGLLLKVSLFIYQYIYVQTSSLPVTFGGSRVMVKSGVNVSLGQAFSDDPKVITLWP